MLVMRPLISKVPADVFSSGWPQTSFRLKLDGYVPAAIMVSSFLLYYFLLVPVVFPATKPQGAAAVASCKAWRSAHNFTLFIYSGMCCAATIYYLWSDGQFSDWQRLLCTPVEGTWLRVVSVTFTLSKLVEWIDTAFLVWLGRSPPEFLHK